jgi:hypothetical protein
MPPSIQQRAAHSARMSAYYHARKAAGIVPALPTPKREKEQQALTERAVQAAIRPQPVAIAPPPPMPAAERQRLESERTCLERELAATQRGIDHLNDLLAA